MIYTVRIDDSTRTGKKLLSDLTRARKGVEFDNPLPDVKTYSVYEAYERGLDQLTKHYGVDIRKLKSKL